MQAADLFFFEPAAHGPSAWLRSDAPKRSAFYSPIFATDQSDASPEFLGAAPDGCEACRLAVLHTVALHDHGVASRH